MFDRQWPPPSFYTTFDPKDANLGTAQRVRYLDDKILKDSEGHRIMRYQVPQTPVKPGSVNIDGALYDRDGELFTFERTPRRAGTINYETGVFEIDIDVSPGVFSRMVTFAVAR